MNTNDAKMVLSRTIRSDGALQNLQTMVFLWSNGYRTAADQPTTAVTDAIEQFHHTHIAGHSWAWCKGCGGQTEGICCNDGWIAKIDPELFQ